MQCVFVHGWAMNSAVWDSLIEQLPACIEPICIDLPGHGNFNQNGFKNLQDLVDHLLEQASIKLSGPAVWVGWSLGALPVIELARQNPQHVSKLMLIASNPCFVTREGWTYAVDESVFDLFAGNLQQNFEKTIQRFLSLQVQGMEQSREVLRTLREAITAQGLPSEGALNSGLDVLKISDLRKQLSTLTMPQLWLLGDRDTLVPAGLNDYLSIQSTIKSHIISGSAHLPFISHTEEVMQHFLEFTNE